MSQAITAAVLAAVEDSKPDHCMFKRVFLYQTQIYVDLMAGIAVHMMQWPCLYIFETLVYSLSRWKYVKQFVCIIFANITMLHLYICTYGLWPEIKFYYNYYYKTVKINTPKMNGKTRATTGKMDWGATIGDIVRQVVLAIQPPLIKVVTLAVTTATRQLMTEMAAKRKCELDGFEEGGPAPYI